MTARKVIVFGPTGSVASAVATASRANGASVVLAMRDPSKKIERLSSTEASAGGYERVAADLTDAASVGAAVRKTGAKHAFIYMMRASTDGMKSTIEAMKEAGIETVAYLSSYTVRGDPAALTPAEGLAWVHAQPEIHLRAVFGEGNFTALRAGYFASNISQRWKHGILAGDLQICYPETLFDWVVAEDIAQVAANLLAPKDSSAQSPMPAYLDITGPRLMTQTEAAELVLARLGRKAKVSGLYDEEAVTSFAGPNREHEQPARTLIDVMKKLNSGEIVYYPQDRHEAAVSNVRKYAGREPTTLEQWTEANKHQFSA